MEKKEKLPLHALHLDKFRTAVNRAHILLHSSLISLFLYYRVSHLFNPNDSVFTPHPPMLPCLLLFGAELILCFLWLCEQTFHWRPVNRTAFVDRLPEEPRLPPVDVLIFTADPDKEPTVEVMNTVVSAMALDYPVHKLHVYLSDDSGSPVTLASMVEAWGFATWWVPFCRRYGIECRSPMAYFEQEQQDGISSDGEFVRDRLLLKDKYELFEKRVKMNLLRQRQTETNNRANHPSLVQVINENCTDPSIMNPDYSAIPSLVYVAREKRLSHRHHFKAGALNVLLRVSGLLSNSPVALVLDRDMYCNDPTSAKQAMCFYLDPDISPSLAFVQFPQRFHNLRSNDIYDNGLRSAFKVQIIVTGYGLFEYLEGTLLAPEATIAGTNNTRIPNPAYQTWQRQDLILQGAILGTLTDQVLNLVTQAKSSKAVWDLLQQTYATASRGHKKQIKAKLQATKKGVSSISDYMQNMKISADLLASLLAPVNNEDLTEYVLKGLDSSFQSVIDGVNNRETPISFHELHERLILKELDLKIQSSSDGAPATALTAQKSGKKNRVQNTTSRHQSPNRLPMPPQQWLPATKTHNPSPSQNQSYQPKPFKGRCQYCTNIGHPVNHCQKFKEDYPTFHWPSSSRFPTQPPAQANTATTQPNSAQWLVDSGASHHVTNDLNNLALHNTYTGPDNLFVGDGTGYQFGGNSS